MGNRGDRDENGTHARTARDFVKDLVREFNIRHFSTHASSTAYFYFLSLVPICIFVSALLPFAGMGEDQMLAAVMAVLPDTVSDLIEMVIRESFNHSSALIPISVVTLLWTSIQGNMSLLRGMNNAYQVHESRPYWMRVLISFVWTTLLMLVFVALLLLVFNHKIREFVMAYFPAYQFRLLSYSRGRIALCFLAAWLLVALSYWLMPNGRRRFEDQLPGALVVALAWVVFSGLFSVYVNGVNKFTTFYGSLGTFAIALFWMYCCFYILLVGGFANCYFEKGIHRLNGNFRYWLQFRLLGRLRRGTPSEDATGDGISDEDDG